MATVASVGVDNGGSWIRFIGLDARGRRVWSLRKPSPTVEKLPVFLKNHLRRFRGRLDLLTVGSRGVWKPTKRQAVKRALRGIAKKIVVMSDVEAAWLAAFGHGGQGIILISGTGSIAYGRRPDGTVARAGGLGPDKGDEGSGYWIGKEWLRNRFPSPPQGERAVAEGGRGEGAIAVRKIASLAPAIIRKARSGHPLAGEIIRSAQLHLAALAVELIRDLSWKGTVPVSVSGSVLENAWFQRGFLQSLRAKGIKFILIRKQTEPAAAPLRVFLSP